MQSGFGAVSDLIVVVRVPKSASSSLAAMALQAFPDRRIVKLPNTLDLDGRCSALQRLRHARHVTRLVLRDHGTLSLTSVFDKINAMQPQATMVTGGHIDFDACRTRIAHRLKMITIVRNPIDRSVSEYAYARAGFTRKPAHTKFDASLTAKAAGRYSYEGFLDFLIERSDAFGDITSRYLGWDGLRDLDAYFAENVFHFGVVDDLRSFAAGLARKTGHAVRMEHLNTGPSVLESALKGGERSKLERLYPKDFELYDWCRTHETAHRQPKPRTATVVPLQAYATT